jgi:hypothetical protein
MKKLLTIIAVLIITVNGFSQVIRPARVGTFTSITVLDTLFISGSTYYITVDGSGDLSIVSAREVIMDSLRWVYGTDGTAVITGGVGSGFTSITSTTLTDGTASLSGGRITALTDLIASDTVQAGKLYDGTATITGGVGSGFSSVSSTTLTDGTLSITGGRITSITDLIATDTVQAGTFYDGTAKITGGAGSGFTSISGQTLTMSSTGSFGGDVSFNDNFLIDAKLDSTYLTHNKWLEGVNLTGSRVNMLRIDSNNILDPGLTVGIGSLYTVEDAGQTVIYNQSIGSSVNGTVHSADMQIDDVSVLKIRSESDGGGASAAYSTYAVAKDLYVTDFHTDQATVTGDTEFTSVVPAKFLLKYLIAEETAGNAATLDLGTTAGASDVFLNQVFAASTITTVVINKVFSFSAVQSLFLNDDDGSSSWNSGSLNVYFVIERISE